MMVILHSQNEIELSVNKLSNLRTTAIFTMFTMVPFPQEYRMASLHGVTGLLVMTTAIQVTNY
jgi:hypothetical protein